MIECPHCGVSNREESKFCASCGQPLDAVNELACPMCSAENPPESTVCSECGARLVPVAGPPSEEESEFVEEEAPMGEGVEGEEAALEAEEVAEAEEIEEVTAESEGELEEPTPPWLEKLREVPAEEGATEEGTRLARAQLPEWLEIPPEFEEMLSAAAPVVEDEDIARAEIPSWLESLRPGEEDDIAASDEPSGPVEATGLLKGIRGALNIEPILAIPRRARPLSPFSLSTLEVERAHVFERVVGEPARARVEILQPRRVETLAAATIRWLIYLIIVISVAVPILLGSNWAAANMRVTGSTIAMYDTIQNLPAGSVVLVSHDYDPGVAAEMIPQAKVVLHHLMEREVRLINVSLTPEGPRLAQQVLEEAAEAHEYAYGEEYLNLGYIVGAEVGPRSIVQGFPSPGWTDFVEHRPFSEFTSASDVDGLEDIALIVELAGGADSLRLWLEQVQAPYQIPMVAGVSATADPFARPYYNNQARKQLRGLVSGLVGAAEYEQHSGRPGSALASMDSQSLVHIVLVLLVLFGNVVYLSSRLKKG